MGEVWVPDHGVELVEGVPGSGKSLFLVREMCRVAEEERRPIFTNLPLVWRACRWYLRNRGGEKLASLLFELNHPHFQRFCVRQRKRAAFRDEFTGFRRDKHKVVKSSEVQAAWVRQFGEDVVEGPEANWIHPGAVVIIDEAHKWFPQNGQTVDRDAESYVTMHRHHFHRVLLATQNRMQVSVVWRRNLSKLWVVRAMGEDKLAWGIRYKHLWIQGMGYAAYTGDQIDGKMGVDMHPIENYVFFPQFPWNQHWFRLYRSFTHVASASQMRRQLERARLDIGLTAAGADQAEVDDMNKRTGTFVGRMITRALVASLGVSVLGIGVVVGVIGERYIGRGGELKAESVAEVGKQPPQKPVEWGKFTGAGQGWARIGGVKVAEGSRLANGAELIYVGGRPRSAVIRLSGDIWVWRYGALGPSKVGPEGEVYNVVTTRRTARSGASIDGSAKP